MTPPSNVDDYDRIPCSELHQDSTVEWPTESQVATSFMAASSLNLHEDGSPLTLSRALNGPHREDWLLAADKEIRKLITTTQTMRPILKSDIPVERRKDITYYNPVCREKMKDGQLQRRVRGTIGGDRIHYTGDVSARTASLEVVRTLLIVC